MRKYCIECERVVNVELLDGVEMHEIFLVHDDTVFCLGNFTSCPPPTDTDLDGWEWTLGLPEPSEDEMLIMDMNAEVLEADFIGEQS